MGCAVNGPGEAGDADFGIAGGRDVGFIYAHGRVLKKVASDILIDELFLEIDRWIEGGHAAPEAAEDGEAGGARDGRGVADPARLRPLAQLGSLSVAAPSQLFLPTLRDDPADAEAVCHKLLVRGGFIRQVERRPLDVPAARLARAPRRSCRSSARRWTRSAARRCSCRC